MGLKENKSKNAMPVEGSTSAAQRFLELLEERGNTEALETLSLLPLLDQISCAFTAKDLHGRYLFANRTAMDLFGLKDAEALFLRTLFEDGFKLDKAVIAHIQNAEAQLLAGAVKSLEIEIPLPASSSRIGWLHVTKTAWRNLKGDIIGTLAMGRDVTEHRRAEFLRRGHATILEQIARAYPLPVVLEGLVTLVEAQLSGITASILFYDAEKEDLRAGIGPGLPVEYTALLEGLKPGENVGSCGTAAWLRQPVIVADTFTDRRWQDYAELARTFDLRSCWSTPILDPAGHLLGTFALYSHTVREPTTEEMELTAMATDLAAIAMARAKVEEQIRHLAMHDPLTGLPNRRMFIERFQEVIIESIRRERIIVVAYLDLDDFKMINDTYGHATGDLVLREVACRLAKGVRGSDLTVRLGGDEFAVAMPCAPTDELSVRNRLRSLHDALLEPIRIDGGQVVCGCSMGISVFPEEGKTPEELLESADSAMYQVKRGLE